MWVPPYEGVHLVLIWHHRSTMAEECHMHIPLGVLTYNLGLRPRTIVLRLDEGNKQQIYRAHVYTTPLMVGDGKEVVPIPPWFSLTWLLVLVLLFFF